MRFQSASTRLLALALIFAGAAACKNNRAAVVKDQPADSSSEVNETTDLEAALDAELETSPGNGTMMQPNANGTGLLLKDSQDAAAANDWINQNNGSVAPSPTPSAPVESGKLSDREVDDVLVLLDGKTDVGASAAWADIIMNYLPELKERVNALPQDVSAQPANGTTPAENGQSAELSLVEPPNSAASADRARLARIEAARRSQLTNAIIRDGNSNQAICNGHGAILRGDTCQCRGWGADVIGFSFPIPRDSPARAALLATPRRCPHLDDLYCVGDATKNGLCGIFSKSAGYNTPAIVTSARVPQEAAGECWFTIDKMIKDNRGLIFGPRNSCGEDIAIERGRIIEIWKFNTTSGDFVGPVTGAGPPGGAPPVPSGDTSRVTPPGANTGSTTGGSSNAGTSGLLTGTILAEFERVCRDVRGINNSAANWNAHLGCVCGPNLTVSALTYAGSATMRQNFRLKCQTALNR